MSALGQSEILLIADDDDAVGIDYRDASLGSARDGDFLRLAGPLSDKLPIEQTQSFSRENSGLLEWQHRPGGSWEMAIQADDREPFSLVGFDSLVFYVNSPDAIGGHELPRVRFLDNNGSYSTAAWMSTLENVRVNGSKSGFVDGSATNVTVASSYLNVLPADHRRPGYPANLVVEFSDTPLDTSQAAIGAPATPAHFRITIQDSGVQLNFRFRDVDGDHTLSVVGDYVDVLLPEDDTAMTLRPAWRLEVLGAGDPVAVPAAGDIYRLVLDFDEFTLDGDVDTWQRLSFPLLDAISGSGFSSSEVVAVSFVHGGSNTDVRTLWVDLITAVKNDDESFLDEVQRLAFDYFWKEANAQNGLIRDRSTSGSASSIAAVGFGLSAYTVGIDRGWITRQQGIDRTLATLRFFWQAPQSTAVDATGYKGFFYHFLDMTTGRRRGTTELSTIDTALLIGGVLHTREYYDGASAEESEIRALADSIYERIDWQWAQARPPAISHGWRPESGFISFDWIGYNEAMILYILALGSPTHPVETAAWTAWTSGYASDWQTHYGITFLTFPPLFGHQYSHVWIDFRGIQDAYMRGKGIDYFENSRRATLAQRQYHIANPKGWPNYAANEWGLTASDIPSGYRARGAPPAQNDDGTIAPTAPGGSIPFAPDESIAALREMRKYPRLWGPYGFRDAYNVAENWFDTAYLGIDQGPILLMAENFRTERIWDVSMANESLQRGLARAGFEEVITSVDENPHAGTFQVLANYPNPFAESTSIDYMLPEASEVRIELFDLLGRRLTVIADGVVPAGHHSVTIPTGHLPSGVYLYRLTNTTTSLSGKMMLSR